MWKVPPLNSLRAVEAAGRHQSFTLAAEELCVTLGAVSRHIAKVELFLGAQLFERRHRQVELTPAGARYVAQVREAFARIDDATRSVNPRSDPDKLRIKVPPTFAIKWLVPRLGSFQARHPRISVQITTPFDVAVFEPEIDLAVSYGLRVPPGLVCEKLFDEMLTPIASAGLVREHRLERPSDLARCVLLHSMTRPADWQRWLEVAGVADVDPSAGLRFENCSLVYQAVAEGLGVGIAQRAFISEDVAAGRLVTPFPVYLRNDTGYFLVYSKDRLKKSIALEFRRWLREEASRVARMAAFRPEAARSVRAALSTTVQRVSKGLDSTSRKRAPSRRPADGRVAG
jgi:LysR family glycine cleavage system transcriptional activator